MGFAFDPDGRLFVGNRERGDVFGPITRGDNPPPVYASGLGAVADIAFDEAGYLYACKDQIRSMAIYSWVVQIRYSNPDNNVQRKRACQYGP